MPPVWKYIFKMFSLFLGADKNCPTVSNLTSNNIGIYHWHLNIVITSHSTAIWTEILATILVVEKKSLKPENLFSTADLVYGSYPSPPRKTFHSKLVNNTSPQGLDTTQYIFSIFLGANKNCQLLEIWHRT